MLKGWHLRMSLYVLHSASHSTAIVHVRVSNYDVVTNLQSLYLIGEESNTDQPAAHSPTCAASSGKHQPGCCSPECVLQEVTPVRDLQVVYAERQAHQQLCGAWMPKSVATSDPALNSALLVVAVLQKCMLLLFLEHLCKPV